MRAGIAVLTLVAIALPGLARGQSPGAGIDASPAIPLHPSVPTILQFPDEIVYAQVQHRDEFMVAGSGNNLAVRPQPDTPAGIDALLEVQTRTMHRYFKLRVVARAEDAMREVVVSAAPATPDGEAAAPEVAREVAPAMPEPVASAPSPAPPPTEPEPTEPPPAESPPATAADTERVTAADSPRFDLSVHAFMSVAGATALDVAGYEPYDARQSHRAFGMRFAGTPRGDQWSLEASISGEWLVSPTIHGRSEPPLREVLAVRGPWLRAEVGMRAWLGTILMPTAYVGIGLQAHFLDIETTSEDPVVPEEDEVPAGPKQDMPFGGVLALGLGLQYRAGDVLLGLELHMRQGVPADYRSVAALLSVGFYLDQGE